MGIGVLVPVKDNQTQNPADSMDPREADLNENMQFAKDNGVVYWDVNILKRSKDIVNTPTCCYFYNSEEGLITHKATFSKSPKI